MKHALLDQLAQVLSGAFPRRNLIQGLAAAGLALPCLPSDVEAKKRKKKRKKPKPNTFGCLDVGKACAGKSSKCCSGLCQGKKPKKGKKDQSKCVAHNSGGCSPEQDFCTTDPNTPCGVDGACGRTTGNAGFCADSTVELPCAACKRDTDCELGFGPGAACLICEIACPDTGGTVCARAAA